MENEKLVTATDFCSCYNIDISFIQSLSEFGLIETTEISQQLFISADDLWKLEQIVTLHYQLDINLEGVEAISHLLQKIQDMQTEIIALKNRLRFYE
jgi:chaperone modulatory protein CbpM